MITKLNNHRKEITEKINKVVNGEYLYQIANQSHIQEWLISQIQEQLANRGVKPDRANKYGRKMLTYRSKRPDVYAKKTIRIKKKRSGLAAIYTHVTLYNKGDFYRSMKVVNRRGVIDFKANFNKEDGNMNQWLNLESVLGLTGENLAVFNRKIVLPILQKYFKK